MVRVLINIHSISAPGFEINGNVSKTDSGIKILFATKWHPLKEMKKNGLKRIENVQHLKDRDWESGNTHRKCDASFVRH